MSKRLVSPVTHRPYPRGFFDAETVATLMLLQDPEECDIAAWTPEQLEAAGDWSMRSHLRASDNNTVRVPAKPAFLPAFRPFEASALAFADRIVRPERPNPSGSVGYETR